MAEPLKKLFTRDEYYALAEAGILKPEDRFELVEGEIYCMPPIGNRHAGCVTRLVDGFAPLLAARRAMLSPQNPVALTDVSEPQPDITLLRRHKGLYAEDHPTPEDVLLLVEVSDCSVGFDRHTKMPLYARCGITEAWLVDLGKEILEVYRDPVRDPTAPYWWRYRSIERHMRPAIVAPLALPSLEIAVADLVP